MQDFTSGNATRQILAFSLPMLLGNIFQQFYSMVDAVVVGNYVGGRALAAVGTSMNLLNFLLAALIGLTTGASVVIAQFYGARDRARLKRAVSTTILFLAALSLLLAVVGIAGVPLFLRMLNTPPDILADAVLYLRILMGGMFFPIFYNMYTAFLRALGDSRSPLVILVLSTLINLGLDLFFVIDLRMGVAGAAWATVIAQTLAMLFCYLYMRRRVPLLQVEGMVFDRELFGSILRYSIPAAVQLSLVSLANLTITRLVNGFGSVAVAGYTAAARIDQFATMPVNSVSMAVSTFVAQNFGAGREDRARQGLRSSMGMMVGVGVGMSVLAIAFGKQLIGIFVDAADADYAAIVEVGVRYLSIIVLFYGLFAVFFAFNGFFRGSGDAVIVMVLTIVSLTIRALLAHLLVGFFGMGPEAVAWSIPVGWGLCSLAALVYYRQRRWAGKALVGASAAEPVPDQAEQPQ